MTTSLEVLNACLRAVGERPVTDYTSNHPTAISARQTIQDTNTEFQTKGWWFNKEYSLTLSPLNNGEVIIPSETLSITPTGADSHLVRRNGKLYDPRSHSYNIGHNVVVHIVILLSIDDLPPSAGVYIKALARYKWAVEEELPEERITRYDRDVLMAKTDLNNENYKQLDTNSNYRPVSLFLKQHMQQYGNLQSDATYPGGEPQ